MITHLPRRNSARTARPGLQTEPRDSHPSMYIGTELPAILKPLYWSIAAAPFLRSLHSPTHKHSTPRRHEDNREKPLQADVPQEITLSKADDVKCDHDKREL
jgi:hypothetical protein